MSNGGRIQNGRRNVEDRLMASDVLRMALFLPTMVRNRATTIGALVCVDRPIASFRSEPKFRWVA